MVRIQNNSVSAAIITKIQNDPVSVVRMVRIQNNSVLDHSDHYKDPEWSIVLCENGKDPE